MPNRFLMRLTEVSDEGEPVGDPWDEPLEVRLPTLEDGVEEAKKTIGFYNQKRGEGALRVGILAVIIPEDQRPREHNWVRVSEKVYKTRDLLLPYQKYKCSHCGVRGSKRLDIERAPIHLASYYKHPDFQVCYKALERIQGKHRGRRARKRARR